MRVKVIVLLALLTLAFTTETYYADCPQFNIMNPETYIVCTEALDWLVYLTPMEELSLEYTFAATLSIGTNLQDYCDFLYGFAELCTQDLTVHTITQDDVDANSKLSGLGLQWAPIQTELATFWEDVDWSPCEVLYSTNPTGLATCKAFWNEGTMPANPRTFGMTQCFTTCDLTQQAAHPDLFWKDCMFPSFYEY